VSIDLAPELEDLGTALGVLQPDGDGLAWNFDFLARPDEHLTSMLTNAEQRDALLGLLADVLGTDADPDLPDVPAGETWLPLVEEGPGGLYVLVEAVDPSTVRLSVAGRVGRAADGVDASASVRVPLLEVDSGGITPLVGGSEGVLAISASIAGESGPLVSEDGLTVSGVSLRGTIETDPDADPPAALSVVVQGLAFTASDTPEDLDLRDLATNLDAEAVRLLLAALRARAGSAPELAHLFALLGLGPAGAIPSLPLTQLTGSDPEAALKGWLRKVVVEASARNAWLGELAGLVGATVPTAGELCFVDTAAASICLTVTGDADPASGAPRVRVGLRGRGRAPGGTANADLVAEAELLRVGLSTPTQITGLPDLRAVVRVTGAGGAALVDTPNRDGHALRIGSLDGGVAMGSDRALVPVLMARDVVLDTSTFATLDLTDADAVMGALATTASDSLSNLMQTLTDLLDGSPEARALASLLGLRAPIAAGWTPQLAEPGKLLIDPLRELCCYHARVLAVPGAWSQLLGQLVVLVGAGGAPAVTGTGSATNPWRVPVASGGAGTTGSVDLVVWSRTDSAGGVHLLLGAAAKIGTEIATDARLAVELRTELLDATLPAVPACSGSVRLDVARCHTLAITLCDELTFDTGELIVRAQRVDFGLRWCRGGDPEPMARITGGTVATGTGVVSIPDLDIDADFDITTLSGPVVMALGDLFGAWFSGGGTSWWRLGPLLGLLPGLPNMPGFSLADLPALMAQLQGQPQWRSFFAASQGGAVSGRGTHADPWAVSTGANDLPDLLAWLDPDGPPEGVGGIPRGILPPQLTEALDAGADALQPERLAELLGRATAVAPEVAEVIDTDLGAALRLLRDRLADTDGIVPNDAQVVTGWQRIDLGATTHLAEPGALDLAAALPGLPAATRRVFVSAPLPWAAGWPDADPAKVIDLREAGRDAATFAFDHVTGDGPWHVLLPARSDAVSAAETDGLDGLTARLLAAVTAVRNAVGGPVALIAHGTSGHAARRVAATPGLLTDVVTVGTPHGSAPLAWLADDDVRHGVRVLQRLRARAAAAGPTTGLLETVTAALDGIVTEQQGTDTVRRHVPFPFADYTASATALALAPGVTGHCVVGALASTDIDGALTEIIGRGIQALAAPPSGRGLPKHLGLGARTRLKDNATAAGEVRVDAEVRADIHLVEVSGGAADHRAVPALRLHADISRNDGWLVAPPSTGPGERQDPRVRRVSVDLSVELGEPAPAAATAAPRISGAITLHDVSVLGRWHERWVIDSSTAGSLADGVSGASGALPEARMLLGLVAASLGTVPATGALRRLADLLTALDVAELDTGNRLEFVTDGVTQLLTDPDALLADLRATSARWNAFLDALAAFGGGSRTADAIVLTASSDVEVAILGTLPAWSLRLRTLSPVTVAKGIALDTAVTVDGAGRVQGSLGLVSPVELGPVGRPRLQLGLDTDATGPVSLSITLPDDQLGALPATVALLPTPDLSALGRFAAAMLPGELLRHALTWAHGEAPAVVDPLLDVLGLLAPTGAPLPVRSCAGLLADPGEWLASAVALGGGTARRLEPVRMQALVDAFAGIAGQTASGGTLALPGGLTLRADAAPDGRARLVVAAPSPAPGTGGVGGSVGVLLGDDLDLAPAVSLEVRLGPVTGLDDAGVTIGASGADPTLAISVTPTGGTAITLPLLPASGWGTLTAIADAAAAAAVQHALPFVLDAAADQVPAIGTLGDALAVRTAGDFDGAKLQALATDPSARVREATAVPALLSALDDLLDAVGVTAVTVTTATSTIAIEPVSGVEIDVRLGTSPQVCVSIDPVAPVAGLSIGGAACVGLSGVTGAEVSIEVTQTTLLGTDPVKVLPFLHLEVGDLAPGADRLLIGLWNDTPAAAARKALAAGLPLTSLSPALVCLKADRTPEADTAGCVAEVALSVLLPLVGDVVLAADAVQDLLDASLLGTPQLLGSALDAADVVDVVSGTYTLRADVFSNLDALPSTLLAVGAQLVVAASGAAIGDSLGPLSITPVVNSDAGRDWYGLRLQFDDALTLADGSDIGLAMDGYRGDFADDSDRGIAIYLVSHPTGADIASTARCTPRIEIDELGLRMTGAGQGALLDEPIGVAAIGLFGSYDGRVTLNGAGDITGWATASGGMRLAVRKLSIPLGTGSDGGNPVAQKMLSQAEEPNAAGDDEQLAAGFDLEIEVTTSGFEVHVGLGDPPWWIPVQRSFGPLYVDQFGLVVEDLDSSIDTIGVLFDGGLELAGLAVGVDDLGILYHLDDKKLELALAGLAIAYDGGGLRLSGGLRKHGADYLGMLQLQFSEYGLTAVGGWGEHPAGAPQGQRYTALFVFGVLTAPLGGPPPFFVTAIGAGFGVNRRLVLPARIEDVPTFPLVDAMRSDSTLAQNPMGALNKLAETFPPHRGTFWFAAGVRFTSFVLVESVAVLGVEVGDGLEVSVLGLSQMVLPDPSLPMASVELALRARFSTREGVLAIQAQLTDNSWLISESCRLTGGFAFVVWFRTGQFVLTLGGYHPRFPKPADFPDVPRLGFHWLVSSTITIKGGLYFALTSSAVMVGGSLEASYRTSWAWAAFEMGAHALIMWDPFHYDFEVYIRVSAGVRIRICVPLLGCATIGFSFSIGARVHILGPKFRGTAELDLDVVTITVGFGASGDTNPDQGLEWDEFRRRYLTDGDAMTGLEMSLGEGRYVESGAPASDADEAVDGPWELLPEFVVLMTTTVASNFFNSNDVTGLDAIDLGPMRIAGVQNELTVSLHEERASGDEVETDEQVVIEYRIGSLPEAVWKEYDKAGDAPPAADLVKAVTGARLIVRSKMLDRTGNIPVDQVDVGELVHPLPLRQQLRWRGVLDRHRARAEELVAWANLQAAGSAAARLLDEGRLTAVRDTSGRWRLALAADPGTSTAIDDAALAANRSDAMVPGDVRAQARTARSVPLAGRAAPPRVRSLASGMRREVGEPVPVSRTTIPAPPGRPAPRLAPRLEAVLHEVAVPRDTAPATSAARVGAGLPRLAPPSLASAREAARSSIGAHLRTVAPPVTDEIGARAGSRAATGIAGDRHEWSATDARLAPSRLRALRRLEHDVLVDGVEVPTGRVYVWRVPDSSRDARQERPAVVVAGDSPVRVVALDRAGRVLVDSTTTEGRTTLPRGTSRVAVAGVAGGPTGIAGWHAGTRLARVSAHTLLAPGAVVRSEAASSRRGGRIASTGLVSPADVVPERGTVSTTLPTKTRTVVVGLEPLGEAATPDGFSLSLAGATRGRGDPVIVRAGERIYGVFGVAADDDAQRVTAQVATDQRWHLAAVVGSPDDVPVVAAWLARGGLEETLHGLAGAAGGSAQVHWSEPRRREDS